MDGGAYDVLVDNSRENVSDTGNGRAALIVNTRSRSGEKVFFKAVDLLQEMKVPLGATYAIRDPARLPETVREVMVDGSGYETLILGGGDGSVSSVVDFLAHKHVTLGLLPLGTANDFARTLGIPSDVESACDTIANGKVVDVDLGLAGDNYFVNVASVGLGVGATEALTPWAKRNIGALAYPVAAIRAFLRHEPFSARLVFPDGDHETVEHERLLQVAVGNGRHYGGGNTVSPTAGIDDHILDIYAILAGPLREHVSIARLLKDGSFIEHDRVYHLTTRRVRLVTDQPLPVNLDGEIATTTPTDFTVQRNAVHVVVPQSSTSALFDGPGAATWPS